MKEYLEQFTNHVKVFDHIGANVVDDIGILDQITQGAVVTDAHKNEAREQYFVAVLHRSCLGKLSEDLGNSRLLGDNVYPKTINDAYKLLCHWKQDVRNNMRVSDRVIMVPQCLIKVKQKRKIKFTELVIPVGKKAISQMYAQP